MIQSFVFLDSETTGLPAYEYNKTKITELCLISAQAIHVSLGVIPRVQNKLTLCFDPQKRIQPDAETVTGLYNDELVNESSFNEISVNLLTNFLLRLKSPICLVAHNGYKFDYPILRNHIEMVETPFPEDILCMDSLRAFREILNNEQKSTKKESVELSDEWDQILLNEVIKVEDSLLNQPKIASQASNETTPPVKKQCNVPAAPKHRRIRNEASTSKTSAHRRLDFDEKRKIPNFKLGSIYEYLTGKPPTNAHQAEEDVKMLLECAVHLGDKFIDYANENAIPFNQIPKMTPGKKVGELH